ncbi:hypothetical protein ACHAXH_005395 [Discostella pseudostelligera]
MTNTKESMRASVVDASISLKVRIKDTIVKRLPETSTTNSLLSSSKHRISSVGDSISKSANDATNQLHKAANTLSQSTITTASQTALQASNQLQDVAKKTMSWLWWWGLAAVGVYGISTTLTKEGVHILKDLLTSSSSSSSSKENEKEKTESSSTVASENANDAIADYKECTKSDCF